MKTKKAKVSDISRLRSSVRKAWMWSVVRRECLSKARIRLGVYLCASCAEETPAKEIKVDHIIPFAPVQGLNNLEDWGEALVRLYDPDNHQALCTLCHTLKTKEENLQRRIYKKYGRR